MNDRDGMFDLYEELRKITSALDEHNIAYALCGGLAQLGYSIRGLDMHFGEIEIRSVSRIHPTTRHVLTLDMLLVTPAIRDVWESRVLADVEGGTLSVVSREGLIALKRFRSSGTDLDDIAKLAQDISDKTN